MKSNRLFVILMAVIVAMAFVGTAFAEDPAYSKPHTWTGQQTFRSAVDIKAPFIVSNKTVLTGTTIPQLTGATGYVIKGPSQGNHFIIGSHALVSDALGKAKSSVVGAARSGITVWVPRVITQDMADWEFIIECGRTGVSEYVIYAGPSASGVTFVGISQDGSGGVSPFANETQLSGVSINAVGEWVKLKAIYNPTTADASGNTSYYKVLDYRNLLTN